MMTTGMTLSEAEHWLREDGRWEWLLEGQKVWTLRDLHGAYVTAIGVEVGEDVVRRWFHTLYAEGRGAENYRGQIGWRARRESLIKFFAEGKHLHNPKED